MVLTVPVLTGNPHPRRRSVLAAGAAVATAVAGGITGCSLPDLWRPDPPDRLAVADADTLQALAAEALDLAARYDRALVLTPAQAARLAPLRDAHREHAVALRRSIDGSAAVAGPSAASPGASHAGTDPGAVVRDLAAAERAAADRAVTACVKVAAHHAPLVGTIAAARASHAEALS